jgi:Xaa-Pro aminopeptidase
MIRRAWWSAAFVLLCPALAFAESAPPDQTDFPPEDFQARWKTNFERIGNEAIAMLQGAPKANGFLLPRKSNEFYQVCGSETPHAYPLLDGRQREVTLYLPPRDERPE